MYKCCLRDVQQVSIRCVLTCSCRFLQPLDREYYCRPRRQPSSVIHWLSLSINGPRCEAFCVGSFCVSLSPVHKRCVSRCKLDPVLVRGYQANTRRTILIAANRNLTRRILTGTHRTFELQSVTRGVPCHCTCSVLADPTALAVHIFIGGKAGCLQFPAHAVVLLDHSFLFLLGSVPSLRKI